MRFNIFITAFSFSISLIGQSNENDERRRQYIRTDSTFASILGVHGVVSNLGNFTKNDTIYYPDKSVLRISHADSNGLNGLLVYFRKDGTVYRSSKLKDNEYCDTSNYYDRKGALMMREVYGPERTRVVNEYYETGELKRVSKVKVVDVIINDSKNSSPKNKQKMVTEGEQYFDRKGNKITREEYRLILVRDHQDKQKRK